MVYFPPIGYIYPKFPIIAARENKIWLAKASRFSRLWFLSFHWFLFVFFCEFLGHFFMNDKTRGAAKVHPMEQSLDASQAPDNNNSNNNKNNDNNIG